MTSKQHHIRRPRVGHASRNTAYIIRPPLTGPDSVQHNRTPTACLDKQARALARRAGAHHSGAVQSQGKDANQTILCRCHILYCNRG
jgi:hypothetical protein